MTEVDIQTFEENFLNALNLFNTQKWYDKPFTKLILITIIGIGEFQ